MSVSSIFNTDITANKIKQTYVQGFVDISGGDLSIQTGNINFFNKQSQALFRMSSDHFTVKDTISLNYVDVSFDKLIQLNYITNNVDQQINTINQRITAISYGSNGTNLSSELNVSGGTVFANTVSFSTNYPTWGGAAVDPSLNNQFVTKSYVDINGGNILLTSGRTNIWSSDNSFNGYTAFNNYAPTYNGVAAPVGNSLVTKTYVDINGGNILLSTGRTNIWSSDNSFNGNTAFNNYAPTYNGVASFVGNSLVTKSYVDQNGGTSILNSQNLFTQINSFQADVSMGQTLIVMGDISLNGTLRVGGSIATNVTALNFDCGGPYTNYDFSTKFDAGGV